MIDTSKAFLKIVKAETVDCGDNVFQCGSLSEEEGEALYALSASHDLAHIVGDYVLKNRLVGDGSVKRKFEKTTMTAVYRYENMNAEIGRICDLFEEVGVEFVLLKGAFVRGFYPEPWQRTSCDADILIKETEIDKTIKFLTERLDYKLESKNYHDYSLFSNSGVHVELHFSLNENIEDYDKILSRAWDYAKPKQDRKYERVFENEFAMFHLFAHSAYHFSRGGCGVRAVLDFCILNRKLSFSREALCELLKEAGLKDFADNISLLAEVWFGEKEHTELTLFVGRFILSGGVYGTGKNHVAVQQAKRKGKFGNIMARIWLPYKNLVIEYPFLKGRRILQLFYEFKRWCRLFKKDARKRCATELKNNFGADEENVENVKKMLSELGLKY